jgi:hypothetical protein
LAARWDEARLAILSSLLSLFAHYRTGEAEPLVLKFVSIDSMSIGVVRSLWPDVPCVMVIRDPVEVMVTTLNGRGWMDYKELPEVSTALFGWKALSRKTTEMTDEEYCARILGSFCAAALEAIDHRCMIVDYEPGENARDCKIFLHRTAERRVQRGRSVWCVCQGSREEDPFQGRPGAEAKAGKHAGKKRGQPVGDGRLFGIEKTANRNSRHMIAKGTKNQTVGRLSPI